MFARTRGMSGFMKSEFQARFPAVATQQNTPPRPLYSPDWSTVGAEWLLSFVSELLSRHFIVAWLAEVPRVAVFVTAAKGEREFVIYDRRCIDEVLLEAPLA
jgi:hypothetical protein